MGEDDVTEEGCHPVSGSSFRLALFDRFHEGNTKISAELLRRVHPVNELKGKVNTQVEEQLHGKLNRSNHVLNQMDPVRHIFMFRSILDKHNEDLNKKISEDMTKKSGMQTSLDKLGRTRVRFTSRPRNKQKLDGQDLEDRSSGGKGSSTSHPTSKSASEEEECLDEDPHNSVPEREKIHVENVNDKGEKLPEETSNDNCNSNSAKELKKNTPT